ncbi:MAG: enoyl-CoA hydratase/isomerase family protein [Panacagrimonas sp.]
MFQITRHSSVTVVAMNHLKANAMDVELCDGLSAQFEELSRSTTGAIVLTGQGRIFSAGVDLLRLLDGGAEYVQRFLPALSRMFNTVFECPKPVISAINGAAVAGGCVLACAADHRVIADKARMGVPELLVGVPFPTSAAEIMRYVTAPQFLAEVLDGGAVFEACDARDRGLVDRIASAESLLDQSIEWAATLARLPPAAFALTKRQLRAPTTRRIREDGPEFDAAARDLWARPETHAAVRDYVQRTFKPAGR